MIWQNAWAFAGLLALAVPLAIHLLGRRTARIRKFPSLRFVTASHPISTRRTRPTDIPLLIVRMAILASAVVALARPLFVTEGRERELGRALTRAIIVDTGASMRRPARGTRSAESARDAARRRAQELAGEASSSAIIETVTPADGLAGGVAWLATRTARREIVIVSDFQTNAIDRADLAVVPPEIGIDLARIDVATDSGPIDVPARVSGASGVARIRPTSEGVTVEWSRRGPGAAGDAAEPVILTATSERASAEAARAAALATVADRPTPDRPIAVVYRGFEGRDALVRDAKSVDSAWHGDVLASLRRDSSLAAVARSIEVPRDSGFDGSNRTAFVVVSRSRSGVPLVVATRGTVAGRDRLLLFFQGDAGSLASAALIAAAVEATATTPPATELDPTAIPDATLSAWRRPAARATLQEAGGDGSASDGRWFWIVALLLLALETWMRRVRQTARRTEAVNERAA